MQAGCGLDGVRGVVGQQRRDFQRDPAIGTAAGVEDRAEQVGGLRQLLECEFEEQVFIRQAGGAQHADAVAVGIVRADGVFEQRRVGGQARHRQFGDVARQRAAGQQRAADAVEPEALPEIMELAGRCHGRVWAARPAAVCSMAHTGADARTRCVGSGLAAVLGSLGHCQP